MAETSTPQATDDLSSAAEGDIEDNAVHVAKRGRPRKITSKAGADRVTTAHRSQVEAPPTSRRSTRAQVC